MMSRHKRTKIELSKPHIRDFIDIALEEKVSSRKIERLLLRYFGIHISHETINNYYRGKKHAEL